MSADPTRRFSERAEDYDRYRPGYPADLIPLLVDELGLDPDWRVADIGSGTGLSSAPFLDHGNTVFGVEPNPDMRRMAEARLGARDGFRSVAGTAERTTLPPGTVDLVVAAQAFHWFDPEAARSELRRILKPDGWLVLAWNSRRTRASPFMRAYERLVHRHGTDYDRVRHDRIGHETLEPFFGGDYGARVLSHEHVLDREGAKGRVRSTSYLPGLGEEGYPEMIAALEGIVHEHGHEGRVRFLYRTEVYFGKIAS